MTTLRPRTLILFLGDVLSFTAALWLALYLRTFSVPSAKLFNEHLQPFSLLFVIWVAVFFIAGLYESRSIILARRTLSAALLVSQTVNVLIAALFFFFVPIYGIEPKTVLFIYLLVSFALVLLWRAVLFPRLMLTRPEPAIMVGEGPQIDELVEALARAPLAPARVTSIIEPSAPASLLVAIKDIMRAEHPRFVIADWSDPRVAGAFPELYNYLRQGVRFIDALNLYEEVFGRISLSHINDQWVARNVSRYAHTLYDSLKRAMDIVIGIVGGTLSLVFYPFIIAAIKLDDGGPIFIAQQRVGQDNKIITIYKFRSMSRNEQNLQAAQADNKVTRVGRVLRVSRLDELPQFWSLVNGDLSFVGPRPELPSGVAVYEQKIPYYNMRHLIKPGLSGWAQLYHDRHPHHGEAVEATREKFSFDLYYLKHRSLILDGAIILKTIKKLLTRSGV